MLRPSAEEQNLPDCNQLIQQEAQLMETRLRRKMIVKPKTSLLRGSPIVSHGRGVVPRQAGNGRTPQ
jgi:hypothetical protein